MSNAKSGPWNAETIRQSRKTRSLTQAELAEALGCRQQTISEWELGMYEPKNAYQKLLSLFFGSTPVVQEEIPVNIGWHEAPQAHTQTATDNTTTDNTETASQTDVTTEGILPHNRPRLFEAGKN